MLMESLDMVMPIADDESSVEKKLGDAFPGSILVNSVLSYLKLKFPDFTGAVTIVVTIVDRAGDVIYTSSSVNDNGVVMLKPDVPVDGGAKLVLTLSGVAGIDTNIIGKAWCDVKI